MDKVMRANIKLAKEVNGLRNGEINSPSKYSNKFEQKVFNGIDASVLGDIEKEIKLLKKQNDHLSYELNYERTSRVHENDSSTVLGQLKDDIRERERTVQCIGQENEQLKYKNKDLEFQIQYHRDNEQILQNTIQKLTKAHTVEHQQQTHTNLSEVFLARLTILVLEKGQEDLRKDCRELRRRMKEQSDNLERNSHRDFDDVKKLKSDNRILKEERDQMKNLLDQYDKSTESLEERARMMVNKFETMRKNCMCSCSSQGESNFGSFGAKENQLTMNKDQHNNRSSNVVFDYNQDKLYDKSKDSGRASDVKRSFNNDKLPNYNDNDFDDDYKLRLKFSMVENEKQEEMMLKVMQENEDLKRKLSHRNFR